jgi:glutamine---fructose-6-phosphate transaminase (isomerizing)
MENKLWLDIQAQGENLKQVVQHLYTSERPRIETAAAFLRGERPIVLIGVASAAYVCMPAEMYLGKRGISATVLGAADALYSLLPMLRASRVVINSRSGETVEIVKLAHALVEHQIPFVALTNEPESTLARMADHWVWANTRKDELVSINVVTGMMTATLVLAAAVTGEMDALRPSFEQLANELPIRVARAGQQAGEIRDLLAGIRPIYLLYRGASKGAACCGRLVLEEVARTAAIAMEASEFRQGPNEVIDERFGAVVFLPEGKQGLLNRSLADDIVRSGGRVLQVGAADGISSGPKQAVFPIPTIHEALQPVLEVVPVQMLAYELAKLQGYEPGTVRYITKVIQTEEGIPNQG